MPVAYVAFGSSMCARVLNGNSNRLNVDGGSCCVCVCLCVCATLWWMRECLAIHRFDFRCVCLGSVVVRIIKISTSLYFIDRRMQWHPNSMSFRLARDSSDFLEKSFSFTNISPSPDNIIFSRKYISAHKTGDLEGGS